MMSKKASDDLDSDRTQVTPEVGDEGGGAGDVEVDVEQRPATGSEAGEAWRPAEKKSDTVAHDETGVGRRSP